MCRDESVKISMDAFIRKYQPDKYEDWLNGQDVGPHPEKPHHVSAAPLPSNLEVAHHTKL